MKDGIYFSNENGGITYFILNEKILMRLMGQTYKCTKHFPLFYVYVKLCLLLNIYKEIDDH